MMKKTALQLLHESRRSQEPLEEIVASSIQGYVLPSFQYAKPFSNQKRDCIVFYIQDCKVYCPVEEVLVEDTKTKKSESKRLMNLVGTTQKFIILDINEKEKIAVGSILLAQEKLQEEMFQYISSLGEQLEEEDFEATILDVGRKELKVDLNGVPATMPLEEFSHVKIRNRFDFVMTKRFETVKVRMLRIEESTKKIIVSRKATMPKPYDIIKNEYAKCDAIAAVVSMVDERYGIFVQLREEVELKAIKPVGIPAPIEGDIVTVQIKTLDDEKESARCVILGYPNGKSRKYEKGSFLRYEYN
ncbi:MAG: hypothetical protein ACI35O_13175 [Bacillaceae bacterium]